MNVQEMNTAENESSEVRESRGFKTRQYVELPPRTSQQPADALSQLSANIHCLENLQSQLSFMLREIRSLNLKKR